jgi:hypothetical protein
VAIRIEVRKAEDGAFHVRVSEGKSETRHTVTLKAADYERLAQGKVSPEELIRRSFVFLLEHESKESVLSRFDLMVISQYFPRYQNEIRRRVSIS